MMLQLIHPGMTVFDVGASIGWYVIQLNQLVPDLQIYAFEPAPQTYSYLTSNLKLNNISDIKEFNFGFSNEAGTHTLSFDPSISANASMRNVAEKEGIEQVECRFQKMDDFVESEGVQVDFIKCDVEGAELLVFQGGLESIKKHQPIIFSEMLRKWSKHYDYHPNDIIKLFSDLGYGCFTIKEGGLVPFKEMDDETIETNFFFLHSEKHKQQIQKKVKG